MEKRPPGVGIIVPAAQVAGGAAAESPQAAAPPPPPAAPPPPSAAPPPAAPPPQSFPTVELLRRKKRWTRRGDVFPFLFFVYPTLALAWNRLVPVELIFPREDAGEVQFNFWVPALALTTGVALICHALAFFVCQWSVRCRKALHFSPVACLQDADFVFVASTKVEHRRKPAICPLNRVHVQFPDFLIPSTRSQKLASSTFTREFEYLHKVYRCVDERALIFSSLLYPTAEPIQTYLDPKGLRCEEVRTAAGYYKMNVFEITLPTFLELFGQHVVAPFFVFQIFSILLWLLDEYWMHSLTTLGMLVLIEVQLVFKRLKDLGDLRAMRLKAEKLYAFRDGAWGVLSSEHLLPGDLFALPADRPNLPMPCDALLLSGSAVVNEASLTGESVPQTKVQLADASGDAGSEPLCLMGKHRCHALFAGTEIMSTQKSDSEPLLPLPKGSEAVCLCRALRTGFNTTQGKIVRKLLQSTDRVTGESKEAFLYLFILLVCACISSAYVLRVSWADAVAGRRSKYKLLLNCVMIITAVVPPEFPITMSMAVTLSMVHLVRKKIYCTEPFRLPDAGRATVCIFDKTGTLTSDSVQVHGVAGIGDAATEKRLLAEPMTAVPADGAPAPATKPVPETLKKPATKPSPPEGPAPRPIVGRVSGPKKSPRSQEATLVKYCESSATQTVPFLTAAVLAACGSLSLTPAGELVGDSLEIAAATSTGFRVININELRSATTEDRLTVVRRFPFASDLQRMTVVATHTGPGLPRGVHGGRQPLPPPAAAAPAATAPVGFGGVTHLVLVKGSVERVRTLLASAPEDYAAVAEKFQLAGYRVLALAYKVISPSASSPADLRAMDRAALEQDCMHAGFVLVGCPIKKDTPKALAELRDSAHRLVMCTGDHVMTSCQVAASCGLLRRPVSPAASAASICHVLRARTPEEECTGFCFDLAAAAGAGDRPVSFPVTDAAGVATLFRESGALCVTGPAFRSWRDEPQFWENVVPYISIMARMAPQDKELVVRKLRERRKVIMCGDGTNDVGALKAAQVGISLLSSAPANGGAPAGKLQLPTFTGKETFAQRVQMLKAAAKAHSEAVAAAESVQLGTASIASPFTYKGDSVQCVPLIVSLGRATLATVMTTYKSMAVNSVVTAFALSVLTHDGVKLGDLQTTVEGALVSILVLASSRAATRLEAQRRTIECAPVPATASLQPAARLSAQRPVEHLFHPAVVASIVGQAAVHLTVLFVGWRLAAAHRALDFTSDVDGEFTQNIVNTTIFYLLAVTHGATFLANYDGLPFMAPLRENAALNKGLRVFFMGCFFLACQAAPGINRYLALVPYPSSTFKIQILLLMLADISFAWLLGMLCNRWSVHAGTAEAAFHYVL